MHQSQGNPTTRLATRLFGGSGFSRSGLLSSSVAMSTQITPLGTLPSGGRGQAGVQAVHADTLSAVESALLLGSFLTLAASLASLAAL